MAAYYLLIVPKARLGLTYDFTGFFLVVEKRNQAGETGMAHFPKLLRDLPPFDGPFDAYKLQAQGCDVLFASYPKGTAIPPHSHDTENVGVITQGELILLVNGKETRYRPGQWYHLPAKETHAARFEMETSEIEFWFHATPRA